ncbi:MAG: nickel-dependent hydrogenase large subunit [Candidatus Diapherotrites archaeon]
MHGSLEHDHDFDLVIDPISKIEGHAELDIKVRNSKVEDLKLKVNENKRFYTQAIRGKHYNSVPQLVSRICGTCSIAHLNCSIEAFENALAIEPSEQTILLRKLTMYGLNIRDHAMHLYLFSLPDLFGKDSILELEGKDEKWIKDCFDVKASGNSLSTLVLGRAVHGMFAMIGSYAKLPEKSSMKEVSKKLLEVRDKVIDLVELFYEKELNFESPSNYVCLGSEDFDFLSGEIISSEGYCIPEKHYWSHVERVILPYSQSTGFKFEGQRYRVGALSRLNLNRGSLNKKTKKDCSKFLSCFPSHDVFHNNLAQAIEIVHCIDSSIDLLESLEFKQEEKPLPKKIGGKGIGAIEAPRGLLYYMVEIDEKGIIKHAEICTPSQQNQINMEHDLKELIPLYLDQGKEKVRLELERLIRAYDPCFSCASHFLKINWR